MKPDRSPPKNIETGVWAQMVEYWENPINIERSKKAAQSRKTDVTPETGPSKHTSGRKPFSRIMHALARTCGKQPSLLDVLKVIHTRKDGTIIDGKAKNLIDKIEQAQTTLEESQATALGMNTTTQLSQQQIDELYVKTVKPNKYGRIYGLGSLKQDIVNTDAGEGGAPVVQKIVTLQRRLQELEEQVQNNFVSRAEYDELKQRHNYLQLLVDQNIGNVNIDGAGGSGANDDAPDDGGEDAPDVNLNDFDFQ
ncbi:PREDICTED: uncharacterized protein LOC104805039 [Tarenaya hassleriana]|uniref:uncharacterized protein LOC104805039 n=1 Tax=Tarenaya hassleriana TaxID=28532 RepID=UPI00053C364E|nr:PREDICTED: uncharacterized protein LOC104805039 [Tarenaya hassleriana]